MSFDPLGLEKYDPFDMVDDYLAEDAGSKAAFLANIYVGMEPVAYLLGAVAQLNPFIGNSVSIYNIASGSGTIWDVLGLASGGVGRAARLIGRSFSSFYRATRLMRNARIAAELGEDVLELHHVVPQFMGAWRRGTVVILTQAQHRQYHAILDDLLRNADNMPPSNAGRDLWMNWLANNPGQLPAVKSILFESVERFRRASGVDMTLDLFMELRRQGWLWKH